MAKATKSTALMKWDEELAKEAALAAGTEATTGGGLPFFSVKSGQLAFGDAPVKNNQMGVIILDSVFENVFYEGDYDPENPRGPTCFAFNRKEDDLQPHKVVVIKQTELDPSEGTKCDGCWANQWGSAEVGRGKACKNTRRLAVIVAGDFNDAGKFQLLDDPEHYKTATPGYLKLPVTSVKGYSSFVTQVAQGLKRPPFGIVTKVKVVPDAKSQFKITFEPITEVPEALLEVIMERRAQVKDVIETPYAPAQEEEAPPPKPVKSTRPAARPAAKPAAKAAPARAPRKY